MRVAGFATAIRRFLLPVTSELTASHPRVRVLISEHEPAEALDMLAADEADLALTYDYNLAPAPADPDVSRTLLWTARWGLGVPAGDTLAGGTTPELFAAFREHDWIGNSRNTADEDVIRTLAAMTGFIPRITHQADSLDLVQDIIIAGVGVGLLPIGHPTRPGVRVLPLTDPKVELRAYAVARHSRLSWPPLALVTSFLKRLGDQNDAAVGAGVGPGLRDVGQRDGAGADPEGSVGQVPGERRQLGGDVRGADRSLPAADDGQPA